MKFVYANFVDVQVYTATLLDLVPKYVQKFSYQTLQKPVYRGIAVKGSYDVKDYKINSIGSWHKFTSTSTD